MSPEKTVSAFGRRIYGLGMMAFGIIALASANFILGQPVPRSLPGRTAVACAAGAFMLAAGAAIQWRSTAAWGAAGLTAYYALIVVVLMNGRLLLHHSREYVAYDGMAEQLSIAAGALVVYATTARISAGLSTSLTRLAQLSFAVCALVFGGAHFVYMNMTAPLVPRWLPPTQHFWAYATGLAFLAAGIALLTGRQARLAAILLAAMLTCFAPLVHWPMLLADRSLMNWTEAAVNLAVTGAAWLVAGSVPRTKH